MMSEDNEKVYRQSDMEKMVTKSLKGHPASVTQAQTKAVIDTLWDKLYDAMIKGYTVKFHGKGQFYLSQRSARTGRNPNTGIEYDIPQRELMAYRVSRELSKRMRADRDDYTET